MAQQYNLSTYKWFIIEGSKKQNNYSISECAEIITCFVFLRRRAEYIRNVLGPMGRYKLPSSEIQEKKSDILV